MIWPDALVWLCISGESIINGNHACKPVGGFSIKTSVMYVNVAATKSSNAQYEAVFEIVSVFILGLVWVSLLWRTVRGKALRSLCESGGTQEQIAFGCHSALFNAPSLISFFVSQFNGRVPVELNQMRQWQETSDWLMCHWLDRLSQKKGGRDSSDLTSTFFSELSFPHS